MRSIPPIHSYVWTDSCRYLPTCACYNRYTYIYIYIFIYLFIISMCSSLAAQVSEAATALSVAPGDEIAKEAGRKKLQGNR